MPSEGTTTGSTPSGSMPSGAISTSTNSSGLITMDCSDSFKRLINDGFPRIFGNPFQDQRQNDLVTKLKDALFENQSVIDRVFVQFIFNGEAQRAEQSQ